MRAVHVASPDDADQFERQPSRPTPVHHKLVPGSGVRVRHHARRGSVDAGTGSDRSMLSGDSTEADVLSGKRTETDALAFSEIQKGEEGQPSLPQEI